MSEALGSGAAAGPARPDVDQAPPIDVPLRFFLTAPVFGVLAAVGLALAGPSALASRWSPPALALTHLLTLGVVAMAMFGAVFQLLPVVVGVTVRNARRWAAAVHALLVPGTLALAAGLWSGREAWLAGASVLLGPAVLGFVVAAGGALGRARSRDPTARGMRLAVLGLAAAGALGVTLVLAYLMGGLDRVRWLTDLHAGWALIGWVGVLVVGVAYQLVPMFQVTPAYPLWLQHALGPLLAALLVGGSIGVAWSGAGAGLTGAGLMLALAGFAGATLGVLARRRRRRADPMLRHWQLGMASLLACAAVTVVGAAGPGGSRPAVLGGVLYIVGFAGSVISGMLYKIVPFLVWLHAGFQGRGAPATLGAILPERWARRQLLTHAVGLALLVLAALRPDPWVYPAAAAQAAAWGLLGRDLLRAARIYRCGGDAAPLSGGG